MDKIISDLKTFIKKALKEKKIDYKKPKDYGKLPEVAIWSKEEIDAVANSNDYTHYVVLINHDDEEYFLTGIDSTYILDEEGWPEPCPPKCNGIVGGSLSFEILGDDEQEKIKVEMK